MQKKWQKRASKKKKGQVIFVKNSKNKKRVIIQCFSTKITEKRQKGAIDAKEGQKRAALF